MSMLGEREILEKYAARLERETSGEPRRLRSDYEEFRAEALSGLGAYEKLCVMCGKLFHVRLADEEREKLEKAIEIRHLRITAGEAAAFGNALVFGLVLILLAGSGFVFIGGGVEVVYAVIPLLMVVVALLLLKPATRIPVGLAARWKLRASNQLVESVLYLVMYLRHTSNLEHALKFAAEHVGEPLALDLKKVFWDVEIGKYSSVQESLDAYLVRWHEHLEFIEAVHLIEGSLYEADEGRRVGMLEKALEVMLQGSYEGMLHYAQELKNPITMIHMLGVILPILGLVILPLVGSLMGGSGLSKIIVLLILYNVLLPLLVYVFGMGVLARRPAGMEQSGLRIGELQRYEHLLMRVGRVKIWIPAGLIAGIVFLVVGLIGLVPLLIGASGDFEFLGLPFLDYKGEGGGACVEGCYGPFGAGSVMLGLFFPLALALSFGVYYQITSRNFLRMRKEIEELEAEFSSGLFQLGNRVGDGVPAEVAFGEVAGMMEGSSVGGFFRMVAVNLGQMGMNLKEALFGDNGALRYYPSKIVESSMKVLLQASRKGSGVVAASLMGISHYLRNIHSVQERLRDLLSDILSSMQSQITFLTPVIAGIVVGIGSMIVTVLSRLTSLFVEQGIADGGGVGGEVGGLAGLTGLFEVANIIPSYWLQMIIGVYVIEITIVLTLLMKGIEAGGDEIGKRAALSKHLYVAGILYFLIALVVTFVFTLLARSIELAPGV